MTNGGLYGLRPYKGRAFQSGLKVQVYRNLHNGLLSVRQRGLVIGHINSITLLKVKFHIDLKKHANVIQTQSKNVHAVASGYVSAEGIPDSQASQVYYNPFTAPYFRQSDNTRIDTAVKLHVRSNGYMVAER
ncbi:hypothetical protein NSQ62_08005 [Solibacillus sp. FSL H8-0523]|uniref:hypothetical protein n=1 Tax=Solibacillus sp. FSL H8-0523 TaxID=2954511 RepID=UPI003100DC81